MQINAISCCCHLTHLFARTIGDFNGSRSLPELFFVNLLKIWSLFPALLGNYLVFDVIDKALSDCLKPVYHVVRVVETRAKLANDGLKSQGYMRFFNNVKKISASYKFCFLQCHPIPLYNDHLMGVCEESRKGCTLSNICEYCL